MRLSLTKGVMRFGKSGNLCPRFVGPFEILDRVGLVAYRGVYRLVVPLQLSVVHNVFHVSMLQKYKLDPSHVIAFEPLAVKGDLSYEEQPVLLLIVGSRF